MFIVKYIHQSEIDLMEKWSGGPVPSEILERRKYQVRVGTESGAIRLVDSLRASGNVASYYPKEEL